MLVHIILKKKKHKPMIGKKKERKDSWSDEQYILNKSKSIKVTTVGFTHSHNKCYNIFTKNLFSVVIGHNLVFYYFISTYK